jgi:hypothetical protein
MPGAGKQVGIGDLEARLLVALEGIDALTERCITVAQAALERHLAQFAQDVFGLVSHGRILGVCRGVE